MPVIQSILKLFIYGYVISVDNRINCIFNDEWPRKTRYLLKVHNKGMKKIYL